MAEGGDAVDRSDGGDTAGAEQPDDPAAETDEQPDDPAAETNEHPDDPAAETNEHPDDPAAETNEESGDRTGVDLGDDPLAAWAVGTLHATLFVLVPVLVAHVAGVLGDLLAGAGTLPGLVLFALLWAAVWWASRRWLRGANPDQPLGTVTGGATWGAAAGLAFLPAVVLALLVGTGNLPLAAIFLLAGAVVAPLVGAVSGGLLAVVDLALLRAAQRLAPAPA